MTYFKLWAKTYEIMYLLITWNLQNVKKYSDGLTALSSWHNTSSSVHSLGVSNPWEDWLKYVTQNLLIVCSALYRLAAGLTGFKKKIQVVWWGNGNIKQYSKFKKNLKLVLNNKVEGSMTETQRHAFSLSKYSTPFLKYKKIMNVKTGLM